MISKDEIIDLSRKNGFVDIGFTTAEPFAEHREFLKTHSMEYGWTEAVGLGLISGSDPVNILPEAKTIIVLIESYFNESFPPSVERNFGRCYLDDDRVTKENLSRRTRAFISVLKENGMAIKVPAGLPHRMAAVRAGTGTLGKNCLLFSNNAVRRSSWILPVAIVIDREIEPDNPTYGIGCPDWCRNACVAACPTRALSGSGSMDPRKCISFLSYFGDGITPAELREPMGMYVYGCDICQNVCPRNAPWLSQALPVNKRVQAIEKDFDLSVLLHMDKNHFESRVWPRMFYMGYNDIWRWKMNVARVMGNSLDPKYVPDLERAFDENNDERVRGMIAWALGRIGGKAARRVLEKMTIPAETVVKTEIDNAMERISS